MKVNILFSLTLCTYMHPNFHELFEEAMTADRLQANRVGHFFENKHLRLMIIFYCDKYVQCYKQISQSGSCKVRPYPL